MGNGGRESRPAPDVHVRPLPQPVEVPPDRQLLAQLLADAVLDVLVADVALGAAGGHLEHDELVAPAGTREGEHRQHRAGVGIGDDLGVVLGELVGRHVLRRARGGGVGV
jgi:hypothetical protein